MFNLGSSLHIPNSQRAWMGSQSFTTHSERHLYFDVYRRGPHRGRGREEIGKIWYSRLILLNCSNLPQWIADVVIFIRSSYHSKTLNVFLRLHFLPLVFHLALPRHAERSTRHLTK